MRSDFARFFWCEGSEVDEGAVFDVCDGEGWRLVFYGLEGCGMWWENWQLNEGYLCSIYMIFWFCGEGR